MKACKDNQRRINKAKKVVSDERRVIALTDYQLLEEINDWLPKTYKISKITFQEYKAWKNLLNPKKQKLLANKENNQKKYTE